MGDARMARRPFSFGPAEAPLFDRRVRRRDMMDEQVLKLLVERAGLEKALAEFPEDVAAAAAQATTHSGTMRVPADPTVEPWPPMRLGATR